jgi:hypothetical protein
MMYFSRTKSVLYISSVQAKRRAQPGRFGERRCQIIDSKDDGSSQARSKGFRSLIRKRLFWEKSVKLISIHAVLLIAIEFGGFEPVLCRTATKKFSGS